MKHARAEFADVIPRFEDFNDRNFDCDICPFYDDECSGDADKRCFCEDIKELLIRGQELESAQTKWISVEERLPEDEVVAANFAPGTYGYKEYLLGYVCPPRDTEPGGCYAVNDYEILHNVTHWLPLPPAPNYNKEEQS